MSDRWKEIEALFEAALECPSAERSAWLRDTCDDAALREDVARMLTGHERADGILDAPLPEISLADSPPTSLQRIGAYEIVREIGRGGMGTVYLAERADGAFEQQVAIKLVRPGLDTEEIIARFLHERQILASLQHAGIARLFDGGRTEDGRPFFVMEYVEGRPIDAYCDAERLSIQDRLRLFVQAARAVQYAHRNLVVHRDLKPSNILVTEAGAVKLLDFGIAKLLDPEQASHAVPMTRTGIRPMTPEYASPEQTRGNAISTASDVYQLGVVLYELLTGHRPYHLDGRWPSEVERVICETQPTRPSTVVLQLEAVSTEAEATTPEQISHERQTSPQRLQKKLRGDLDTMLLMALRKEPARRYDSVEQLIEDIERYLDGRPVIARPDTLGYRMRKFSGRHRWSMAAAATILILLIGYAVTVTLQAQKIARERDRVRIEAVKTLHVKDFLISLFGQVEPATLGPDTSSLEVVLADGAERIRQDLADQPEIRAEMMSALAAVYQRLERYNAARPLLEDALAARRTRFGDRHEEVASSLSDLAKLEQQAARPVRAESLYREALAMQHELHGEDDIAVAETKTHLAALLQEMGRPREAESLYAEALPVYREVIGAGHGQTATLAQTLGRLRLQHSAPAAAESLFREALALQQRRLPDSAPDLATLHSDLGASLTAQGEYAEAEAHLLEAYSVFEKKKIPEDETLDHLVALYEAWGKPDEAARYRRLATGR